MLAGRSRFPSGSSYLPWLQGCKSSVCISAATTAETADQVADIKLHPKFRRGLESCQVDPMRDCSLVSSIRRFNLPLHIPRLDCE